MSASRLLSRRVVHRCVIELWDNGVEGDPQRYQWKCTTHTEVAFVATEEEARVETKYHPASLR